MEMIDEGGLFGGVLVLYDCFYEFHMAWFWFWIFPHMITYGIPLNLNVGHIVSVITHELDVCMFSNLIWVQVWHDW
jgi:hypothetical protein